MDTGCFQILAIINSAAVNTGVLAPFPTSIFGFLYIFPGMKLLDHTVALFLRFKETPIWFCRVVVLVYIPTKSIHLLHPL